MRRVQAEDGFTLVEFMVAIGIFLVLATTFYQFMFSSARSTDTSEDVVRVSEEARLGLNRLVRDTREGQLFSSFSPNSYNVRVDFNGNGSYENPNANGDYENLTFEFRPASNAIYLNNQLLVAGVYQIGSESVFTYTSNDLHYDWNGDGVTTAAELDEGPSRGFPAITSSDVSLYSNVEYAFELHNGDQVTEFRSQAQLRNRR
jgi:prepilin-type N-terminal cleavage/methylation domain-containing protein